MKLFIFRIPFTMDFIRIEAVNPMFAVRALIQDHGARPYDLVAVTTPIPADQPPNQGLIL